MKTITSTSPRVRHRRFRWRTIAVALVGFYGSFLVLAGAFSFFVMAYTTATGQPLNSPGPQGFSKTGLFIGLWCLYCGSWLIASAVLWWKGRWRLALAMIAVYVVVGLALSATGVVPE